MNCKIVSDSSANLLELKNAPFLSVPLHILVDGQDFTDDANLDLDAMQNALSAAKGASSSSCPNVYDWTEAFGGAGAVFCVTITSALSGSYASACAAKEMYEKENPGRVVYVLDSLSTGPEMVLLIEKLQSLIASGMNPAEIYREVLAYRERTHLFFSLSSLDNLAKNGRVSPLIAKGMGLMGIRLVGKANEKGVLQPVNTVRGDKGAVARLIWHMKKARYKGGRVVIAHNRNAPGAAALKSAIVEAFRDFNGFIHETRGLCSYYAEPQSLVLGFEA